MRIGETVTNQKSNRFRYHLYFNLKAQIKVALIIEELKNCRFQIAEVGKTPPYLSRLLATDSSSATGIGTVCGVARVKSMGSSNSSSAIMYRRSESSCRSEIRSVRMMLFLAMLDRKFRLKFSNFDISAEFAERSAFC